MKTILRSIAVCNLLAALAITQPRYSVSDLGVVGPNGQPFLVTNNGLVSGAVAPTITSPFHAVFWLRGVETDMSAALSAAGFQGPNSQAFGANQQGQIVGYGETAAGEPDGEDFCGSGDHLVCLPFLSRLGLPGLTSSLPTLGGTNGVAEFINSRGQVGGYAETGASDRGCIAPQKHQFKPVLWSNGKPQELSTISGDPDGMALAVNDKGQVAGASGVCTPSFLFTNLQAHHAIFWDTDGTYYDLGTLGGDGGGIGIFAKNLNTQGQVVGWSDLKGDLTFGAFIWSKETGMLPLPSPLPGGVSTGALAINDAGVVTGVSISAAFIPTAVIWENGVNGQITNLNDLIPADSPLQLWTACSITERGEITGIAVNKNNNNEVHGYLLTPK